jgi:hypothetical protein
MDLDLLSRGIQNGFVGSAVESEGDLTKHQPRPGDLSAFRRLRFALWKGSRVEVGRGGLELPTSRKLAVSAVKSGCPERQAGRYVPGVRATTSLRSASARQPTRD